MTMMRGIKVRCGAPGEKGLEFGNEPKQSGHYISFGTESRDTGTPGECSLSILNLNDSALSVFESDKNKCTVRVGHYDTGLSTVFQGNPDPKTLVMKRSGGDWSMDIVIRDGGRQMDLSRLDLSFQRTTHGDQVLDEIIAATGLGRGQIELGRIDFPRRFVFNGPARRALDLLVSKSATRGPAALRWFIRDGNLYILPKNKITVESAVVYSARHGTLVGSPTATDHNGVQFTGVLVDTTLRVGRVVRLESRRFTGLYKAVQVGFQGSNYGQEFYTTVKAVPYK
jgi:hypothetical protein